MHATAAATSAALWLAGHDQEELQLVTSQLLSLGTGVAAFGAVIAWIWWSNRPPKAKTRRRR